MKGSAATATARKDHGDLERAPGGRPRVDARQACGRDLRLYPTIGSAIAAGVPWLTYSCPACQQVGWVDLRTLDRHPGASISSLIPSVSCRPVLAQRAVREARNADG
jgi:hypothetical protein